MTAGYCRGCGTTLQTTAPEKPGYIPPELMEQKGTGPMVCKRCYRITHYGELGTVLPTTKEVRESIIKAIGLSEMIVITVDFSDLTGTLPVWTKFLHGINETKPYILALNKIDLLPARGKRNEVIEYLRIYLKNIGWEAPSDLILLSSIKGDGISILTGSIAKIASPGGKIALLGATNVGKSSLIKRILASEHSSHSPTVSKFPGTTIGLSNWSILKGRNTLIDTPGLVSGDRVGDLLCPECAGKLMPTSGMEQKLWGVKPGKGLIAGGILGVEHLGNEETVFIGFFSPQILVHRTDNTKIKDLLMESPDWLSTICKKCRSKLNWSEEIIEINPNQDLAVAGLGWLSLRGKGTRLKLNLPQGIRWEVRPALIGKR